MATSAMTGKPLIESDRVEGTTVYDPQGNNIGSIKRLMIEKISGRVAYAVMSFGKCLCLDLFPKKLFLVGGGTRACVQLSRIIAAANCTPARKFLASLS
jgi:hypothetical protein